MLRRIQARRYRCLRDVDINLDGGFHALVGPNGSGKSALLDIVAFISDLLTLGLDVAIRKRTRNFQDLVWGRPRDILQFEIALEFDLYGIDKDRFNYLGQRFRYEVGVMESARGASIYHERGVLLRPSNDEDKQRLDDVVSDKNVPIFSSIEILDKSYEDIYFDRSLVDMGYYRNESAHGPTSGDIAVELDRRRSAFDRIPTSYRDFPVTTYARNFLTERIRPVSLNTRDLCKASPPLSRRSFLPTGSNFPWIVQRMQEEAPERFADWIGHICVARPDIQSLRVVDRDDDRHAYLMVQYRSGVSVPSWSVSDGTLRLLALTLIAYLPDPGYVYLLEEPENGVHPLAIESIYQSLSSVYESQVIVTTHSPVLLRCMEPDELICFTKNSEGATVVVSGRRHPLLADWKSAIDTELVFATEFFE